MEQATKRHDTVAAVIESEQQRPGALLPILHGIQDRLGYVPPESIPLIAKALQLSRAEVHGVVSFYHHYRTAPPGRHVVRVCRAEACQAMGAEALASHIRQALGIDFHQTSPDGSITLEPVYCLGNCACSPSLMVDDETRGRVSVEQASEMIAALRGTL